MYKRTVAVWLGFALLSGLLPPMTPATAQAPPSTRQRLLMDAGWRFLRGEPAGTPATTLPGTPVLRWRWTADDAGQSDAARMADPALETAAVGWQAAATGEETFHGRVGFAWFRTTLPDTSGPVRSLHFEGVEDNATVYLNGQRLAYHEGWDDPFDVPLGAAWKVNGPNVLAVLVENTAGGGGIIGPVLLQNGATSVASGPARLDFNDHAWRTVHLPHDYVIEGTFDPKADAGHGSLPTTTGWYRKTFDLPGSDRGKSLWVDFDGVYRDSKVWLNGHFLGRHPSGYTSFRYDVTPYANCGGRNVLAVSVDPRHTEGWWYEGGGIYRHVWLNVADPVHAAPWGTFVTAQLPEPGPTDLAASASLIIKTTVANASEAAAACAVDSSVVDVAGRTVAVVSTPAVIPAGQSLEAAQQTTVARPHLWSLETPYLYHLVTTVRRDGKVVDTTETPFGIRTLRFDPDTGFYLNGKPVKIQGVCNHQDFVGVGIGVPDTLEAWRVKKLKEMGANGWRMSHNPPTPGLLDACDRLGMLVMDENRHLGDGAANLSEVANMVRRDRNHPSIVLWSMCNEENGAQGKAAGADVFKAMRTTVLQNDTTRPVTSAMNGGWFDPGFATVEDILGINYGLGNSDKFHQLHPAMPIFGSETASTLTTRGEYADDKARVFVSSYNMTDYSWKDIAGRPFVFGSFVWTGFDYKGEPTPYVWPCVNSHFGILDTCGFPKDNYYYYQSWWKTQPVVHLMPHWNWPDRAGQNVRVIAFSNAARVELFLNGVSLGAKDMPRNEHLEWSVRYEPGTLSAKGYDSDGKVIASDMVQTTGAPAALKLKTDRINLTPDGEDLTMVEVDVVDAQGRIVPTADNRVTFSVRGAGFVAGVGNGNPGDHDPDRGSSRRAFNGKCLVIVGVGERPGDVQLTAASPGLKSAGLGLRADSEAKAASRAVP